MNKFRSKLLLTLVSLIVVVLVGLGLLLSQLFKGFYIENFNERMERELRYTASVLEETGIHETRLRPETLIQIQDKLKVNITLLDLKGKLLYGSEEKKDKDDTEAVQKLLSDLKDNPQSVEMRYTGNDTYYYGVLLSDRRYDEAYLIVHLSMNSFSYIQQKIWGLLISSFFIAFIVILLLGLRIIAQYTKPIESATRVAIELAKGNYKARAYENRADETGMLSQAINILARNLQEMTLAQEMQQDRLHTLIENMGSGMILIDSRGYISLVNRSYKETFHATNEQYLNRLYYEAFDHQEIIELVEEIFMTEVKVRKQMLLPLRIERKHFEVYGAPIIGTNHEWKGIILVFHDITELKRLEQMRKDFLANVSHELKTPITSIKGFSETLLDGAMEDRKLREYFLTIILKESDRMQNLIADLLDLSKIEQQGFKLQMGSVNLNMLLEEIEVMLRGKAVNKTIDLQLQTAQVVTIPGDPHRLKQIFLNLISNAIVYTPAGGKVLVSLEESPHWVSVKVSDTGIGIEKAEIPRIFERFYRVDKARSRNTGGTGLGLSIVKHLVEAHRGLITVESDVGVGTTFTVMLRQKQN